MKRIAVILFLLTLSQVFSVAALFDGEIIPCGKISDYNYKDGECDVIVANRSAGKQIALTFDDGPSREYTEEILEILRENGARATFFMIGKNAKEHRDIVLKVFEDGHEIGNHTWSHPNMRKLTPKKVGEEISKTQEILKEITGVSPVLFRPPGGYLSNDIVDKITSNGCRTVLWSWRQDTRDWERPSVGNIVSSVLSNLKDGDIILFHDYNTGKSPTPEALRILLPKIRDMGYEFVTVSELVK